jgi:NitT/TauT family transport system permease protein
MTVKEAAPMSASDLQGAPVEVAAGTRRRRRGPFTKRGGVHALQVLAVLAFLAIWQFVSSTGIIDPFFISSPIKVAGRLWDFLSHAGPSSSDTSIFYHSFVTLREAFLGLIAGAVIGVLIGFVLGQWKLLSDVFSPLLNLANTLPRVALAPLFVLWFGIGEFSKVVLVFTVVVFILMFNTYAGTQTVDQDIIAATRLLGGSRWQITRKVTLPWCIPWILSGMRIALAWSLGAAVIGEYLGAQAGVGYLIFYYSGVLDNTGLLAGCVVLLILSGILFGVLDIVQRRLLKWKVDKYE